MAHLEATGRRSAERTGGNPLTRARKIFPGKLERWLPLAIVAGFLMLWEWQARAGWLSALFFPAPSVVAHSFFKLLASGELLANLKATISRLLLGFLLGCAPGLALGLMMGWSRRLRVITDPFIAAAHPIPKIAILPLMMIIFGIGEPTKVIVIGIAVFFPMLISAMAGVRQISPIHFEVAENYGAGLRKVFTRVIVPGSLPLIITGARLALNVALLVTIAVELLAAQEGLGAMIWLARETLRTEELYVSLFVIALLGISFNFLLQRLLIRHVPWQTEPLH